MEIIGIIIGVLFLAFIVIVALFYNVFEVMDEKARVAKAKQKKATEQANRIKRQAEYQLAEAERKLADAQATIKKLKGK